MKFCILDPNNVNTKAICRSQDLQKSWMASIPSYFQQQLQHFAAEYLTRFIFGASQTWKCISFGTEYSVLQLGFIIEILNRKWQAISTFWQLVNKTVDSRQALIRKIYYIYLQQTSFLSSFRAWQQGQS